MSDIIKTEEICIVGGGSAGYMAAAFILNNTNFNVTMVVPEHDTPIGVGEATLLGFDKFMEECGTGFQVEWMKECDAIFKCGILYTDWRKDGQDVWHPFAQFHEDFFKENSDKGYRYEDFVKKILPHHRLLTEELQVTPARGYHIDAGKFVQYMSKKLDESPIQRIHKKIKKVHHDDNLVQSIEFEDGEVKDFDFFIDCGGFNTPFKDFGDTGFVDLSDTFTANAACAVPIKYSDDIEEKKRQMMAVTNPRGSDLGWIWNTPVASRIGTGLVYNKDLNTREEAEAEMIRVYGKENMLKNFNHIEYTPGYHERSWRGNVVSIGLSSGFIEPLESTGIDIFQAQIMTMTDFIKKGFATTGDIIRYNATLTMRYKEGVDYVSGHYIPESIWRDSPFWDKTKTNKVSESLLYRYNKYIKDGMVFGNSICETCMFGHQSWTTLFEGFFKEGRFSGDTEMLLNVNDDDQEFASSNLEFLDILETDYLHFKDYMNKRINTL